MYIYVDRHYIVYMPAHRQDTCQELKEFATTLDKKLQEGEERRLANGNFDCRKGHPWYHMFLTLLHIMGANDIQHLILLSKIKGHFTQMGVAQEPRQGTRWSHLLYLLRHRVGIAGIAVINLGTLQD